AGKRPALAVAARVGYRPRVRADTLGGNADEGGPAAAFAVCTAPGIGAANAPDKRERKLPMAQQSYELKAEVRDRVGKGSARQLRRSGRVPAVIYGEKQPPKAIALSYKDVYKKIQEGGFLTTLATIDVDGEKYQVLPKEYQVDPVRHCLMHVDYLRVGKHTVAP